MTETSERGLFLAFEGVEGSGKSTQVALLREALEAAGRTVVVAREPGSTPLGERIRQTVLGELGVAVPAAAELFLMLAARAAFVEQIVQPALRAGAVVIADRFELSTLAYQGAGRGIPVDQIRTCNRVATAGLQPDATVLLDVDPQVGAGRQRAAAKVPDRLESEAESFHLRVAEGYRRLAGEIAGVVAVDARGTPGEVHGSVVAALAGRFPETFAATGFTTS